MIQNKNCQSATGDITRDREDTNRKFRWYWLHIIFMCATISCDYSTQSQCAPAEWHWQRYGWHAPHEQHGSGGCGSCGGGKTGEQGEADGECEPAGGGPSDIAIAVQQVSQSHLPCGDCTYIYIYIYNIYLTWGGTAGHLLNYRVWSH